MDTVMSNLNSAYAAVVPAVIVVGAAAFYGSRTPSAPAVNEMTAEFSFKNGVLLPHKEYLYGYSDTNQHFIVGRKLEGHDYSGWEAQYLSYGNVESVTLGDANSKATWSWTLPTPKTFPTLTFLQILLCFLLGAVCALLLRFAVRKAFSRLSRKDHNKQAETLALPTSDVDAEHAKLNYLWRCTLISMYRDRKIEIMSLIKLAVHYYENTCNLEKALAKEKKRKGDAESALEKAKAKFAEQSKQQQTKAKNALEKTKADYAKQFNKQQTEAESALEKAKADYADQLKQQQSEAESALEKAKAKHADRFKQLQTKAKSALDTAKTEHADKIKQLQSEAESALDKAKTEHADQIKQLQSEAEGAMEKAKTEYWAEFAQQQSEIEKLREMLDAQTTLADTLKLSNEAIAAENTTAKETIKSLEDQVLALQTEGHVETADPGSENMGSAIEQDDDSPAGNNVGSWEGEHIVAEVADAEADATEGVTEQDDNPLAFDDQGEPHPDDNEGGFEMEHNMTEAADAVDEGAEGTNEQDDDAPPPADQNNGVELGANGRPRIPRANRRRDGTIRTATHPDYVPRPPRGPAGDRNRGRGGGGRGGERERGGLAGLGGNAGRGGNGGAGQVWRGDRGRGGYGGGYEGGFRGGFRGGYGQFNNARGQ